MSDSAVAEVAPVLNIDPDVAAILALPPVKWQEHLDQMPVMAAYDLSGRLISWCDYISLALGYVEGRQRGNDHAKSVKLANCQRTKVRRALGYTCPKNAIYLCRRAIRILSARWREQSNINF